MKKIVLVVSLVLFIGIALTFDQPLLAKFDLNILLFFENIRNEFLNTIFFAFSFVGSIKFLLPLTMIVALYLLIKKLYIEICFLLINFFGVRIVNHLLKNFFKRERPAIHPIVEVGEFSFPSGHAMNSFAALGFIFYLFIYVLKKGLRFQYLWLAITAATFFLIILSRAYLGVHYPSDLIAGSCSGFIFLSIVIYLFKIQKQL